MEKNNNGKGRFVIQEHKTLHHGQHYDFRIEVQGVMKSWVLPKGLPHSLNERRLAIETDDHVEYIGFEGKIQNGKPGAGEVLLWDQGRYQNVTYGEQEGKVSIEGGLKNGHIDIILVGHKIKGKFTLVSYRQTKGRKEWIMLKKHDS